MIYPHAEYDPAPINKTWGTTNTREGVICHSMVGGWGASRSRLMDPNQQASWHYSVLKDGRVLAHYDLEHSPWHAGSYNNNVRLIGIEHEGGAPGNFSEPLTPEQLASSVALVRWIAGQCGWTPSRDYDTKTLWEHRDIHATLCPSGRIPWGEYIAPPPIEEPEVKTQPLNTLETIAAAELIHRKFASVIYDDLGNTAVEVTEGSPVPIPPGGKAFLFVVAG